MSTAAAVAVPARPSDWFGHPRGLTILFLTETWEKFSYYGMRAILIYYLTKQLLIAQGEASLIYGLYTGFAYLTPLIGGPISDRWLGRKRAVVIGGLIMAVGHFMMAFESLVFIALATITIGNGLYLPNLPAQIRTLYTPGDPRARGAVNIYYIGINLGAFLAPFAIGTVGEIYGWHYGFTIAGVGMMVGLATYLIGQRYLPDVPREPVTRSATGEISPEVWRRFALLGAIVLVMVIIRTAYEQLGNTLALWADSGLDRTVGSFTIPLTWFVSLNPLIVFILTPPLVAWWVRRAAQGRSDASIPRMVFGAMLIGLSFLLLAAVAAIDGAAGRPTHWLWFVGFFVLLTIGEIYLLPVGLGLVTRISPAGFAATGVALWFGNAFIGNIAAGLFGSLWSDVTPPVFFVMCAALCATGSLLFLLLRKRVGAAEEEADAHTRRLAVENGLF